MEKKTIITVILLLLTLGLFVLIFASNMNTIFKPFSDKKDSKTPEDISKAFDETMERIDKVKANTETFCLFELFPDFPILFGNSEFWMDYIVDHTIDFSLEGRANQDQEKEDIEVKFLFVHPINKLTPSGCSDVRNYLNQISDSGDFLLIDFRKNVPDLTLPDAITEIYNILKKCPVYLASGYVVKEKQTGDEITTLHFLLYPKEQTIITDISILKDALRRYYGNLDICK